MYRARILVLAIAISFMPAATAQDVDDVWKNAVREALSAASNNEFSKSEQLFEKALREAEKFGATDPRVGTTVNSLGLVYKASKNYAEAEARFRRALGILEKSYGSDSIDVANVNLNIASVMTEQGRGSGAIPLLERSLTTYQRQLGRQSLKAASVFCMIGEIHKSARAWSDAEVALNECASIRETQGGIVNPDLADVLFSLAQIYQKEGKLAQSDGRYRLAEKIREKTLGIMSPGFAEVLEAHAVMLRTAGREQEAKRDAALAAAIRRNEEKTK